VVVVVVVVVAVVAVVTAALPTPAVTTKDKSLKKSWKNSKTPFFLRQQETKHGAGIRIVNMPSHSHSHIST
jgi:hypothetical protein